MRKVLMLMFMTLDGVGEFPVYAEPANDEIAEDPMWYPRMGFIDTIVLGRRAYQKWAAYWPGRKTAPDASAWQKGFSAFADNAEKVVFSRTLQKADWQNSRVVSGDLGEEVRKLKEAPGKDIALGGGPRLAHSFLEMGLVDEMLIEVFPSIVGKGKPLFRVSPDPDNPSDDVPLGAPGRRDFKLLESKGMADGTVFLRYEKKG